MSNVSSVGKVAYIYDQATDTWYPVAGSTDTTIDFSWTGNHTFSSSSQVTTNKTILAKAGINSFTSVDDRNAKISSPADGTMALVVVDNVMQVQYYYNGSWRLVGSNAFLSEVKDADLSSSIYTLKLEDAGKTLDVNVSTATIIRIPVDSVINFPIGAQIAFVYAGTGQPRFEGASVANPQESVTVLSKNNNKKISSRYSQAIIIKKAANTWYLMGDLTA